MILKQYTLDPPYNVSAMPVSWLEKIDDDKLSNDEVLIMVSEPNHDIPDTNYMSKYMKMQQLKSQMYDSLSIDDIKYDLHDLRVSLSNALSIYNGLSDGTIVADIDQPYIISSITYGAGNLISVDGYNLSDALDAAFRDNKYTQFNVSRLSVDKLSCDTIKCDKLVNELSIKQATDAILGGIKLFTNAETLPNVNSIRLQLNSNGKAYVDITNNAKITDMQTSINSLQGQINDLKNTVITHTGDNLKVKKLTVKETMGSSGSVEPNTVYLILGEKITSTD